jgi:hypothetical protein
MAGNPGPAGECAREIGQLRNRVGPQGIQRSAAGLLYLDDRDAAHGGQGAKVLQHLRLHLGIHVDDTDRLP